MYLKALEIQGFKSFPDKTVMTFGSDITGIVGPNGSGKSNISDAIRWVMGEMSTKALRGSKMEDVVFGGTLKRPQVGFAEVSLILDNTGGFFNIESSEVMVTRRYYRSGESEYYINRQTVRLRDINELFMDTGLGKEGYCNIGQGRIDEILSAKSTDRREIFEEAAGISKYRHRKEETERKLQQTSDNLLRINDKISELELQVNPLRESAEKARKYLVLRDELKGLETAVWLSQLRQLSERRARLEEDCRTAVFVREQAQADLDNLYSTARQLGTTLQEMDIDSERRRGVISASEQELADSRSESAVLSTRRQGREESIRRLEKELQAQENRSGDLQGQIRQKENRVAELSEELLNLQSGMPALQKEADAAAENVRAADAALEQVRAEREKAVTAAAETRSLIAAGKQNLQNVHDRRERVRENLEDLSARLAQAKEEETACRRSQAEAGEKVTTIKNRIQGYQLRAQSRLRKKAELEQQANDQKVRRDTIASRIRMYREMERDYEGYSKAARIVMTESERGGLRNICGPVSRLLRTEDDYTVAIETALGGSLNSIVVETEQDGKAAISMLRRRDGGRATFLPVSVIRGRPLQEKDLDRQPGFVGIASELIEFDEKYRGIMEKLLGRTVIAENMDTAIAMAGRYGHRFRIVTLDGQVLNAGGSMVGGSTAKSSGVLTRANELSRLEKQEQALTEEQAKTAEALKAASRDAAGSEAEIAEAGEKLRAAEDDALRLKQSLSHYVELIATIQSSVDAAEDERDRIEEILSGSQGQEDALQQKLRELEQTEEALSARIAEAEQKRRDAQQGQMDAGERLQACVTAISLNLTEQSGAKSAAQELQALLDAVSGDNTSRSKAIEGFRQEIAEIDRQLASLAEKQARMEERLAQQRQELQNALDRRRAVEERKTRAETDAQQKNKDLMDLERECARLEHQKENAEMEERQIIDKLWDSYELTPNSAPEAAAEIESLTAAQKRIGELRRKMNALGHVNLDAIEEFQRVNERYEYLAGQRDDVETSSKELQKIVDDITKSMTGIFTEEFKKINAYFGETFAEMFGGGKASLELEDENDVLSCGIEIKVQPPGKQVKTIMLLSGGEKAFVAIALYFAIMKVRPTPFCMLDEIDAALDDRNVGRFAAYLRNLSGKTQFIVITHRRGTMEAADVLYGVTMQEQGVSKVLSVDLNQVVKELGIH